MSKSLKILIACGGTGGHLFPGIAVAETLRARGHQVMLLISEKKVDSEASAKYRYLNFKTVPAIAKPPTLSPRMVPFLWKLYGRPDNAKKSFVNSAQTPSSAWADSLRCRRFMLGISWA
ncbi:MAG: UDP-N-acetylglucosamine--N-acetylmuramyl-(pentapeptide) pyrophosphoryl-undecaprenol N-acetylglucosamine transferase [Akkermansiaceae bacterium]|nr:UDP-N-acetylglucosamine--N-acetylmuramyl-(pentapeptide) pyrophosphoryl-undecaprenol N-acetylglucosamine transferase [Akkermansiaceae bacterium]